MLSSWLYWKSNSITFLSVASAGTFKRVKLSTLPDRLTLPQATQSGKVFAEFLHCTEPAVLEYKN